MCWLWTVHVPWRPYCSALYRRSESRNRHTIAAVLRNTDALPLLMHFSRTWAGWSIARRSRSCIDFTRICRRGVGGLHILHLYHYLGIRFEQSFDYCCCHSKSWKQERSKREDHDAFASANSNCSSGSRRVGSDGLGLFSHHMMYNITNINHVQKKHSDVTSP